jgi:hypothetical protein
MHVKQSVHSTQLSPIAAMLYLSNSIISVKNHSSPQWQNAEMRKQMKFVTAKRQ